MANIGRLVAKLPTIALVLICLAIATGGGLWVVNRYDTSASAEPSGTCSRSDSLKCKVCQALDRGDCFATQETGCPATTAEYIKTFPQFRAKLEERKAVVKGWASFRKEMEAIQNRSPIEFCQKQNLSRMSRLEAEIQIVDACAGVAVNSSSTKIPDKFGGDEIVMLKRFRDCSEIKSREIGAKIKQRAPFGPGEETAQLHSLNAEITKINNAAIELLTEFREQVNEGVDVKCWLRGRIRDCGL